LVPSKPRREISPVRWLVLAAVIAELVILALGENQWVAKKVADYTGSTPQPGFWHQFVFSTQSMAWRVGNTAGQTNANEWISSLVRVGVAVVLTGALVALIARRGSFWRASVATLVAVVFSTQIAEIVEGMIYSPHGLVGFTGYYSAIQDEQTINLTLKGSTGGGRATQAIFGGPTGYRFVGGLMLGVLVGIVVGLVARRLGEDESQPRAFTPPAPQAPPQTFFPPGEMQRGYEENVAAQPPRLAEPGSFASPGDAGGRHSRD